MMYFIEVDRTIEYDHYFTCLHYNNNNKKGQKEEDERDFWCGVMSILYNTNIFFKVYQYQKSALLRAWEYLS